jgi:hypothetical protein
MTDDQIEEALNLDFELMQAHHKEVFLEMSRQIIYGTDIAHRLAVSDLLEAL